MTDRIDIGMVFIDIVLLFLLDNSHRQLFGHIDHNHAHFEHPLE